MNKTNYEIQMLDSDSWEHWTTGKFYSVYEDIESGKYIIYDDDDESRNGNSITELMENLRMIDCKVRLLKTEQEAQNLFKDLGNKSLKEMVSKMESLRDKWATDSEKLFAERDQIEKQAEALAQKATNIGIDIDTIKKYI